MTINIWPGKLDRNCKLKLDSARG